MSEYTSLDFGKDTHMQAEHEADRLMEIKITVGANYLFLYTRQEAKELREAADKALALFDEDEAKRFTVSKERFATREDIVSFIMAMEVDQQYRLPADFFLKWVKISYSKQDSNYTWSGEFNYGIHRSSGYAHPLRGNMVQFFKTARGAKGNLLLYMQYWIDDYTEMKEDDNTRANQRHAG